MNYETAALPSLSSVSLEVFQCSSLLLIILKIGGKDELQNYRIASIPPNEYIAKKVISVVSLKQRYPKSNRLVKLNEKFWKEILSSCSTKGDCFHSLCIDAFR